MEEEREEQQEGLFFKEEGEEELEVFSGLLRDDEVVVSEEEGRKIYEKGSYGEFEGDGKLHLTPVEALLLVERGRLIVKDEEEREYAFRDLVKHFSKRDPKVWVRYLVYRDLRSRGYVVKQGFGGGIDFRLYPRGCKAGEEVAKNLIYIVTEGTPIDLKELDRVTKLAVSTRKQLTMALVNRQGDVVYYNVLQLAF
ncbi:MAG: tRNA-intron lyase [Candidatus Jordarchaeales archaeon]